MDAIKETFIDPFVLFEEQHECLRKGLLVGAVVAAGLSLVAPLRIGATIASRTVGLATSIYKVSFTPKEGWKKLALKVGLCAPIALGIAGFVTGSVMITAAALITEVSLRLALVVVNIVRREWSSLVESTAVLLISSVALAALLTASWQLMFIAAGVGGIAVVVDVVHRWRKGKEVLGGDELQDHTGRVGWWHKASNVKLPSEITGVGKSISKALSDLI